jgi:hypothetical protein
LFSWIVLSDYLESSLKSLSRSVHDGRDIGVKTTGRGFKKRGIIRDDWLSA